MLKSQKIDICERGTFQSSEWFTASRYFPSEMYFDNDIIE